MIRSAKTYDFILVLKSSGNRRYMNMVSQLMLFMAAVAFIYQGTRIRTFYGHGSTPLLSFLYFGSAIVLIAMLIYGFLQRRKGQDILYRLALFLAACTWYLNRKEWLLLSITYLIAALLEKPLKVDPEVAVDEAGIVINDFPEKRYPWEVLDNLILKDGILTIDLLSNKLIQKETDGDISVADEAEFNDFCRKHLNRAGK